MIDEIIFLCERLSDFLHHCDFDLNIETPAPFGVLPNCKEMNLTLQTFALFFETTHNK